MQVPDLHYTPVWRLRELLDSRQISSAELTEFFLRRIERLNPKYNAFLTVTGEQAMAAAREADRATQEGRSGSPLLGIPISIKDLEATKGVRSTMGSFHHGVFGLP